MLDWERKNWKAGSLAFISGRRMVSEGLMILLILVCGMPWARALKLTHRRAFSAYIKYALFRFGGFAYQNKPDCGVGALGQAKIVRLAGNGGFVAAPFN